MSEREGVRAFDYSVLDEETGQYVKRKTHETQGLLLRTAENIILIGENLLQVQERLPALHFSTWLREEFDLSRQSAYNYMRVARKFGGSCTTVVQLPARVLYELASASDEIITQVEEGQLPPTVEAIKVARKAERQAKEAERQALHAMQTTQHYLTSAQEELQRKQAVIDRLVTELEQVQQQMAELTTSPVLSSSITTQEAENESVPPHVVKQLEALQQQVTQLSQQRDTLSQHIMQLQEEARRVPSMQPEEEHERTVRLTWYRITGEFQKSTRSLLAQWPSPLDAAAFESGDWNRLADIRAMIRRLLKACEQLTQGSEERIVDSWMTAEADTTGCQKETAESSAPDEYTPRIPG